MDFPKPGLEPEYCRSGSNILFSRVNQRVSICAQTIFAFMTVQVFIHTSSSSLETSLIAVKIVNRSIRMQAYQLVASLAYAPADPLFCHVMHYAIALATFFSREGVWEQIKKPSLPLEFIFRQLGRLSARPAAFRPLLTEGLALSANHSI
jgi:hypothetical protein